MTVITYKTNYTINTLKPFINNSKIVKTIRNTCVH